METKEKKTQSRKQRSKNGERDQKMMTFRADWDVLNVLSQVENKGRFLNQLVKDWARENRTKLDRGRDAWEVNPAEDEDPMEYLQ